MSLLHRGRWGAALAALLDLPVMIFKGDQAVDWRRDLRIADTRSFIAAMDQIPTDHETVDADVTSKLLKTGRLKVEQLGRKGHLAPIPVQQNKVMFSRREVEIFANRHILSEEAAGLLGIPSARILHRELRLLGIEPIGVAEKCHIFDRQSVEAAVRAH